MSSVKERRLIDAIELANFFGFMRKMWSGSEIIHVIHEAETVDAVEVVHGRWEQVQRWATKAKYRCSVCGREIMSAINVNIEKYPYCHCGAKMDGGNEDANTD